MNNGDPIPLIQSYLLQYHIARNNIIVIYTLLYIILHVHLHFVQYPQIQLLVGVYLSHHLYTHDSIVFDDVMKLGMHMLTLIIWLSLRWLAMGLPVPPALAVSNNY